MAQDWSLVQKYGSLRSSRIEEYSGSLGLTYAWWITKADVKELSRCPQAQKMLDNKSFRVLGNVGRIVAIESRMGPHRGVPPE